MRSRLMFNSAVLIALTGLFVFAIYNLARLRIPPFRLDPCDAVMHFALFTMMFALIGSLRAFLPYRETLAFQARNTYVLRSQQAAALAVVIGFLAYVVALTRHPSMWVSAEWRTELLAWMGASAVVAIAMELLVLGTQPSRIRTVSL